MFDKLSYLIRVVLVKIIVKVPWLKKWFVRIVYLYERELIKNENEFLSGKREAHLNFRHYLPDTTERIERLRRVINKRPVAIILHGPSLTELEQRITELEGCDICYISPNDFWVPEERILQKIKRNFSVVVCSGIPINRAIDNSDFLERQEDNVFVFELLFEFESLRPLEAIYGISPDEFIGKYDQKLLFYVPVNVPPIMLGNGIFLEVPSIECPLHFIRQNSLSVLLSLAIIGEAPMVVIFGGDGGRRNRGELYFREIDKAGIPESVLEEGLVFDSKVFNLTMPIMLEKIYQIYNLKPVDIINCSLQSNYTPFKKLSYDDTFALMKSFTRGRS